MRDRYANIYGPNDAVGRLVTLDVVLLIGRILLVILFIRSGFMKFGALEGTAGYINSKLGMGATLAPIVAVLELLGGILIAVGFQTRIAAAVLFLFTAAASLIFHDYWNMTGAAATANAINFYKNLGLMGGLLILVAAGPGRYSLDKR
jgi:putative oxidoreductase